MHEVKAISVEVNQWYENTDTKKMLNDEQKECLSNIHTTLAKKVSTNCFGPNVATTRAMRSL